MFPQSFPSEENHYLMWINLDIQNFLYFIICFWKNNSTMGQDLRENYSSWSLIFLFLDLGLFIVPLSLISTINSLVFFLNKVWVNNWFNCLYPTDINRYCHLPSITFIIFLFSSRFWIFLLGRTKKLKRSVFLGFKQK